MRSNPPSRFSLSTPSCVILCTAMFLTGMLWDRTRLPPKSVDTSESTVLAEQADTIAFLHEEINDLQTAEVVVDVIRGDTVAVVADNELTDFAVDGIACPSPGQPFGDAAKQFTVEFCMQKRVRLVGDHTAGTGTRSADVIVCGDSLREALLAAGLAWHAPQIIENARLAEVQAEAKVAKRGLWADDAQIPPRNSNDPRGGDG